MARQNHTLRIILKVFVSLLSVSLIVLCGALLVLSQPQPEEKEPAASSPPLSAAPALTIQQETDLRSLVESFPVPVLSFMSGSGMLFVSGTSSDATVSGGFARVASLYWQTADGEPLILQSICPASALSLLESGYHFSTTAGPTLFGSDSVRMENEDTVRIHAATESGLYVVIVPKSLSSKISALSRSLQLFSVPKE